jgi:ferredoxin
MGMKVIIDRAMCTGHGRCYTLAPEVFAADDEGHSTLVQQDVPESLREKALIGVQNCPERAIALED